MDKSFQQILREKLKDSDHSSEENSLSGDFWIPLDQISQPPLALHKFSTSPYLKFQRAKPEKKLDPPKTLNENERKAWQTLIELGANPSFPASEKQLKSIYRTLAKLLHPDCHTHDKDKSQWADKFHKLKLAFSELRKYWSRPNGETSPK